MLKITVPGKQELWDEKAEQFIIRDDKDVVLRLEHSLISVSKWEAKHHVPFLSTEKTDAQIMDYIKCMTLNTDVDDSVYSRLTLNNIRAINEYIADPMTATTIRDRNTNRRMNEIVTSELIYYWMIAYGIPAEFEKWHINRLIMLIRVCAAKNEPPKKRSQKDIMDEYRAINAANKAKFNTRG